MPVAKNQAYRTCNPSCGYCLPGKQLGTFKCWYASSLKSVRERPGLEEVEKDARCKYNLLELQASAQTSAKCKEPSAGQVLAHERFKHNVSKGYHKL